MPTPKFSVILPAHRYDNYLKQAIKSVLEQSFVDFELILILNGDCSKHKNDLIALYSDPRINYISTSLPNLVFALNLGVSAARSDYIVRMDSDDLCKKHRLEKLWGFIVDNADVDVIGTSFDIIDSSGSFIERSTIKKMNSTKVRFLLPFRCVIPHPTVVFKKKSIVAIGSYGYGMFSEDYDLWLRLARSSQINFMVVDEPLLDYRIHISQATDSSNDLKILAYDVGIKIRELIITRKLIYIPGLIFTLLDFLYKKVRSHTNP